MERVFVSWSGGKDSCLAAYLAGQSGCQVSVLLNMVMPDGQLSWSHGIAPALLEVQAIAMGLPLLQQRAEQAQYEEQFIKALRALREQGISGGVFGDIDFEPHREWVTRVCREAGMQAYLPLWGKAQLAVLQDFISFGFEAIIVATKWDVLGEAWLGRRIDSAFVKDLLALSRTIPVTLCGEAGEYHSIVIDGPLFKRRLELRGTRKGEREGYGFLEIPEYGLRPKTEVATG